MDALTQLFKGVSGLPADFGDKVKTIFEACVKEASEVTANKAILEATDTFKTEKDEYIKTVTDLSAKALKEAEEGISKIAADTVDAWLAENKLALESNLKVQVATEYMQGVKSLFTESAALIGDSKLTEALTDEIAQLKEAVSASKSELLEATKQLSGFIKEKALREATAGLTDVAKDRVIKLAEAFDVSDLKSFTSKLGVIVEAFGGTSHTSTVPPTQVQAPDAITESTTNPAVSSEVQETIKRLKQLHL